MAVGTGPFHYRKTGTGSYGKRWYYTGLMFVGYNGIGLSAFSPAGSVLYATALLGGRGCTIDTMGTYVQTTGASSLLRMGIYNTAGANGQSLYPTSLLVDFGNTATTTGFRSFTALARTLTADTLYWAVITFDVTGAYVPQTIYSGAMPNLGNGSSFGQPNGAKASGMSVAYTWAGAGAAAGALPATFPTGAVNSGQTPNCEFYLSS